MTRADERIFSAYNVLVLAYIHVKIDSPDSEISASIVVDVHCPSSIPNVDSLPLPRVYGKGCDFAMDKMAQNIN